VTGGRQVCILVVVGVRNGREPGAFGRQGGGAGVASTLVVLGACDK
jgi:hypothetical protein